MTTEERRRPAVGIQIKRWRLERGLTLANVAERSGLNVGYLSQIENDKASPSLQCLVSIAEAVEVPAAWFFGLRRCRSSAALSTSTAVRRATCRSWR